MSLKPSIRVYSPEDFQHIASAIRVNARKVKRHSEKFNDAALWFRINKFPSRYMTPSEMNKRLTQISNFTRKLLKALGIDDPKNAIDGSGNSIIINILTNHPGITDSDVFSAADKLARLNEICDGILAASDLNKWLADEREKALKVSKLVTKPGHTGNDAINEWIASMMSIYQKITGRIPRISRASPTQPNAGKATGPLVRFLQAAARPICVNISNDAWAARIEAIRKRTATQK